MSLGIPVIYCYAPTSFAEKILQQSTITIKEGQQMLFSGCMVEDLIPLKNALPRPKEEDQTIRDQEKVMGKIFIILNKFLLGSSYRCKDLDHIHRVVVDFSRREFSLEGPFTFQAEPLSENIELFPLIDTVCRLPVGTYINFSVKSSVLISGLTREDVKILEDSKEASISKLLNQLVRQRFANLASSPLNFFIGPADLIECDMSVRTVEFSKQVYLRIISRDNTQGIHIALLREEEFERVLSTKVESIASKEELASKL